MILSPEQHAELQALENQSSQTRRATVPALEALLHRPLPVLDHGFVRVVDYMGDDGAIVQAARVSYGRGTRKVSEDQGLIRYLMRHRHSTPFEMCEIKYHVKLPIFVARQWIRHRMASINEYSARYSILDREFYIPEPAHLAAQSQSNRQGRGDVLSGDAASAVLELLREDAARCHDHYALMLGEEGDPQDPGQPQGFERQGFESQGFERQGFGLARELARMNLTLNTYTQWYWKADLHNLLNFLALRLDPHAQYEIRVYAEAMLDTVRAWVPQACAAFEEYRLGAFSFSASMLAALRRMLAGERLEQKASGLSRREWDEMMAALAQR